METEFELNEIFDLAFRFVTETSENIFLTGKAGTGKTTFLKYLKENSTKNIIVAAPTGVAAINAGGVTLHSLFQLPFHPFLPTKINRDDLISKIRFNNQRQQLLRRMDLLIIDEISMVRADVMDAIDTILKSVRRNYDLPFGAVQLLCIGDLHQLPPVANNNEWNILSEYYSSPFFFDSVAIKQQTPLLIELIKIYRQKEESFVELLNKVRNNEMSDLEFENLNKKFIPDFKPSIEEKYITLTSHNNQADKINQQHLVENKFPEYSYKAVISDDFPENSYPAESNLLLKEGAQVMFLKNDVISKKYYNGKIGIVKKLEKELIIVDCDGVEILVGMETWENSRYTLNRKDGKLEQEILGSFTQYPLRLAWAITIHKSQGLTFNKIMIDAGSAFSSGQVYVALSRCTSIDGIVLLSKIPSSAIYSNANVVKGQKSLIHDGSLAERFSDARQLYTQKLIKNIYSFEEIESNLNLLHYHVKQHHEKLNPDARNWVEQLKNDFIAERKHGLSFCNKVEDYMKENPVVEENNTMQKRIKDAANYFEPKISTYQKTLQNHPLLTEYKETADIINEHLQQLTLAIIQTIYNLNYSKNNFSVTTYLQHKLNYAQPKISITCYATNKKQANSSVANGELFSTLKRWRDKICEENNLPIYMLANQATLTEISTYLPQTKKDLLLISGFGKVKVDKYGDDILEMIQDYCERYSIEPERNLKVKKRKKEKTALKTVDKPDTKSISFQLYKEGKTIEEIAAERNFTFNTIEGHLSYFVGTGEIELGKLMSKPKQDQIKSAIEKYGVESLAVLFENLKDISFGEIRMVIASLNFIKN